jgi:hypothetical protein
MESLSVIINPPPTNVLQIYPGQLNELSVVVTNQEQQGMVVEVYLDLPERLRSWCKLSRTSFNLDAERSQAVEFQWQIPPEAIPNRYRYDLVIDSQGISSPYLYSLELEILTPIQTPRSTNDPTFTIQPVTSSTNPLILTTSPLAIAIQVHNRSNLVDDYRISCPDLEDNWFTVRYPEGIEQQGMIIGGSKLSLNPNSQGMVTLLLHPPENTIAGNYRPTIRLYSTVKPDLVLQDIFYLTIPPVYQLNVNLQTVRDHVKQRPAVYQIIFKNEGNTIREVNLKVSSGEEVEICEYHLEPSTLKIAPGTTRAAALRITPKKKVQRPFFGSAKPINFKIDVEDIHRNPLPQNLPIKGIVWWEPRPWWQLLLLVLSIILTIVSLIILTLWLFFRPLVLPEVTNFTAAEKSYQLGQEITLNLEIVNPERLKRITITSTNTEGQTTTEPRTFTIDELIKSNCKLIETEPEEKLSCNNIATGAKNPDSYQFTLNVFAKKRFRTQEIAKKETSVIKIELPAVPEVSNVGSLQETYTKQAKDKPARVDLKFEVSHKQQIERIEIQQNGVKVAEIPISESEQVCAVVEPDNLNCYIQVPISQTGSYIFSVQAIPKNLRYLTPQKPQDAKTTVQVVEAEIPLVIELFSIDNKTVSPIIVKPGQPIPVVWKVSGEDVLVTITGVSNNLPAQGNYTLDGTDLEQLPKGQVKSIMLTAKDARGRTENRELFVQIEAPPAPNPSQSPTSSSSR